MPAAIARTRRSVLAHCAVARGGALRLVLVLAACAVAHRRRRSTERPPPPAATDGRAAAAATARARASRSPTGGRRPTRSSAATRCTRSRSTTGSTTASSPRWNDIENPNLIRVGQVLRLSAPGEARAGRAAGAGVVTAPLKRAAAGGPGDARPAPLAVGAAAGDARRRATPRTTSPRRRR